MVPVIVAVVGSIQALLTAVIGGLFARDAKKRKGIQEETNHRAERRRQESFLSMKLLSANTNLTHAVAIAVRDNQVNGVMADALARVEAAQREYYDFIDNVAVTNITK